MKSNPGKCHLPVSKNENTKMEKLLGIQFDNKLSFDFHLLEICKKASRKLYALGGVTPYMNLSKAMILMNVFFNS